MNHRNLTTLAAMWMTLLAGAIMSWGTITFEVAPALDVSGAARWAIILRTLHVGLVGLALIWPGVFALPAGRSAGRWLLRLLQARAGLGVLLSGFGGLVLFVNITENRFGPLVGFGLALIAALLIGWMFYDRERVPAKMLVLAVSWGTLLFLALRAYLTFSAVESGVARWWPVIFLGIMAVLTVYPVLMLVPALKRGAGRALRTLSALPLWGYALVLTLVLGTNLSLWLVGEPGSLEPLRHLSGLVGVISGCLLIFALWDVPADSDGVISPRWQWGIVGGIVVVYLLLAVPAAIRWLNVLSLDAYAYLQIARRYASGEFVVRGHWAPAISWLMAIPMRLGVDGRVAQRAGMVINGLLWLGLTYAFADRFKISPAARLALIATLALWIVKYTFWHFGPDPLLATVLLGYWLIVSDGRFLEKPVRYGLYAGLAGGAAYYVKHFSLPYVFGHLILTGVLLVLHGRPVRKALSAVGPAIASLGLVVLPWAVALSTHFGYLTFTTTPAYNNAFLNPDRRFYNYCIDELCPEPDDLLFPWEDADPRYFEDYTWGTFDTLRTLSYQTVLARVNLRDWAFKMIPHNLGFFPLLGILGSGIGALVFWRDVEKRYWMSFLLMSIVLFLGGYFSGNAADIRFYYPIFSLLSISIFLLLDIGVKRLFSQFQVGRSYATLVLALIVLAAPGLSSFFKRTNYQPPEDLRSRWAECLEGDALAMQEYLVAPMADSSNLASGIAYYTQVRSVGRVDATLSAQAIDQQVDEYGIATLLLNSGSDLVHSLSSDYGYQVIKTVEYCGASYTILRP